MLSKKQQISSFYKKYYKAEDDLKKDGAGEMVRGAIKAGLLIRPTNCERCGTKCKPEAHHEDYSHPLEVIYLCKTCHVKADMARRERESSTEYM